MPGSYALNGWLYNDNNTTADGYISAQTTIGLAGLYKSQNNIRFPSATPMFGDGVFVDTWADANDTGPTSLYDPCKGNMTAAPGTHIWRVCVLRHGGNGPASAPRTTTATAPYPNGGINLGLSDGHVEYSKLDNLWSQYYWNAVTTPKKRPGT